MKKEIIIVVIILILVAAVSTFFIFKKEPKKTEKEVSGPLEVEAEMEQPGIDEDVDIDLDSVPLDMNEAEKSEFNSIFEEYDNKTLNIEQTKELIDLIIDTNVKYQEDGKRFVSIDDNNYSNPDDKLYMRCLDANPYYGGDNNATDVADAIEEMKAFKDSLEETDYEITLIKGRDIVVEIKIAK